MYIFFSFFLRRLILCYFFIIEFAKKNHDWHVICMEYLHKDKKLTDLSLVSSQTLLEVGFDAVSYIYRCIGVMVNPTWTKKEIILFASGNGTKIANQFGIRISEEKFFYIENYFGEPY